MGRKSLALSGAIGAVIGLAAVAFEFRELAAAQERETARLEFYRTEIAKLDPQVADVAHLPDLAAAYLARKQVAAVVQQDRLQAASLVGEVARRRPAGIALLSLSFQRPEIRIEGEAASEEGARAFMAELEASADIEGTRELALRRESGSSAATFPLRFSFRATMRPDGRPR